MDMHAAEPPAAAGPAVEPVTADSIWQLARLRAERTPERVLITDEHERVLTFGQLRERAEAVAAGLFELGIRPGDVTSWQLPSRIDTVVLFMALARLGAIQNPLIPMLRESEIDFICGQTRTRLLVVPSVFRGYDHLAMARSIAAGLPGTRVINADAGLPVGDISALPPAPDPSAADSAGTVRWLFYTSGTTAAPKGAQHTDAGLLAAARTFNDATRLQADDRVAALSPIAHVGGVLPSTTRPAPPARWRRPASPWAARACRSSRVTCGSSASAPTTATSPTCARSWSAAHRGRPRCTMTSSGNWAASASSPGTA